MQICSFHPYSQSTSPSLHLDTSGNILAAVAQFERELIRERVSAGMRNACQQGKRLGHPKGAEWRAAPRLKDRNAILDRQRAVELRRQGLSLPRIARELGLGLGLRRGLLMAASAAV